MMLFVVIVGTALTWIPLPIWIAAGVGVWLVAAVSVSGWIARVIRHRDQQRSDGTRTEPIECVRTVSAGTRHGC